MVLELQSLLLFKKTLHILENSGFWFNNNNIIITHWEHPSKGMQKSNQNRNVEAKSHKSNRTVFNNHD